MSPVMREQSRDRNGIALPDGWAVYFNGELVFSADDWQAIGPALTQMYASPVHDRETGEMLGDRQPAADDHRIESVLAGGPLYPEVTVHLSTGHDGNIGAVMATVREAMRRARVPDYETVMDRLTAEIFGAESYTESLAIVMRYVNVE